MDDFYVCLERWLKECQKKIDEYDSAMKLPYKNVLVMEPVTKFVKIWCVKQQNDHSDLSNKRCWAFVAKEDYSTKTLGDIKRGDVLKPASYKVPAKHARGNLFDEHGGMQYITPHGPEYLK